ncbi:hypothetical protein JCM10213_004796 [Rhodosporidiobolus nylandii]
MAVSLAPAAPPSTPSSLLEALRALQRAYDTRRSLLAELDAAMSSFLNPSSAPLDLSSPDVLAHDCSAPHPPRSTCASEAAQPRAPSEAELNEVLKIGFGGLVEVKEEVRLLGESVEGGFGRRDLGEVVRRAEEAEGRRVRATLENYQLRRLLSLTPSLSADLEAQIQEKESLCARLEREAREELEEVRAEVAELSAAEEEEKAAEVAAGGAATATA